MTQRRILQSLLVAALILADLVVFHSAGQMSLLLGLLLGQLGLLSLWHFSRSGNVALRTMILLPTVAIASIVIAHVAPGHWLQWFAVLLVYYGFTSFLIVSLRPFTHWHTLPSDEHRWTPAASQLTVGRLFSWMTATAFVLAVARWLSIPWASGPKVIAFCIPLSIVAVASLWASLRCGHWFKWLLCCLGIPILVAFFFVALDIPKGQAAAMVQVLVIQSMCVAVGGLTLRLSPLDLANAAVLGRNHPS